MSEVIFNDYKIPAEDSLALHPIHLHSELPTTIHSVSLPLVDLVLGRHPDSLVLRSLQADSGRARERQIPLTLT